MPPLRTRAAPRGIRRRLDGDTRDAVRSPPRYSGWSPVEADCPRVDRVDLKMRVAPRVAGERGPNGLLGISLDGMDDADIVAERPAQDDEARIDEAVHECRVRRPVGLVLDRARRIPHGASAAEKDEKRRHACILVLSGSLGCHVDGPHTPL